MSDDAQEIKRMIEDLSSGTWIKKLKLPETSTGLDASFLTELFEQATVISDVFWQMYHSKEYTTKNSLDLRTATLLIGEIDSEQQAKDYQDTRHF